MRIEPGIDRLERQEAADHQPSSDQQHERQREFRCHQRTTQPVAANAVTSAAPTLFQRAGQIHRGSLDGWGESKRDTRQRGNAEHEKNDTGVDGHCVDLRDVGRAERDQRVRPGQRQQESAGGAHGGQQQALRKELPDHPPEPCAQRGTYGNLPLAGRRARQQHVRDIGARDQQHESDRAHQHQQRRLNLTDHVLLQRSHYYVAVRARILRAPGAR